MKALIQNIHANSISIWVEEGYLELAMPEALQDDSIIDQIRENKEALLAFLQTEDIDSQEAFDQYVGESQKEDPNAIVAVFPATSMQQGLVYHYLTQPEDDAYRVQILIDYDFELHVPHYQEAWRLVSLKYPILRTAFDWENAIRQVITSKASICADHFSQEDISMLSAKEQDQAITEIQRADRNKGFDLSQPGLMRFVIIKRATDRYTVIRSEHHSIADGWSGPFLLHTVHHFYKQLCMGKAPVVEEETAYLETQRYIREHKADVDAYWEDARRKMGDPNDISMLLETPVHADQIKSVDRPEEQFLRIDGSLLEELRKVCREVGVTLNVALQFTWHKLLQTYSGDDQTIVGTTVSGRDLPIDGIESSVGLYANTLPLVLNWKKGNTIHEMLQHVQSQVADLNSYSSVSLAGLQRRGERLFHTMCAYLNYPAPAETDKAAHPIDDQYHFRKAIEKVDYPITVRGHDSNDHLHLEVKYGKDWLGKDSAAKLLDQMKIILQAVATSPRQPWEEIALLDHASLHTILYDWNQTDKDFPMNETIVSRFEKQAAATPEATAVVCGSKQLSYRELNEQANKLARAMHEQFEQAKGYPMPAGTFVALYLERRVEMMVSILATLKAQATYVPIAPSYPKSRTMFMLEDAGAAMILMGQDQMAEVIMDGWLTELREMPLAVMVDEPSLTRNQPATNLDTKPVVDDLAYVIYTSGTTGVPKGVLVDHQAVISFVHENKYISQPAQKVAGLSPYSFDGFVFDAFYSLLNGACVYLVNRDLLLNPDELCVYLQENQIDTFFTTTALFNQLVRSGQLSNTAVKNILFGGEKADVSIIQKALNDLKDVDIMHVYGPTETVVYASAYLFPKQAVKRAPIGKPLNNKRFYVVDGAMKPVPVGVPGELLIGGAGMAKGYLNRPELTKERFIPNPFATEDDVEKGYNHLYRTGDIVRWLPSGDIEFVGRVDRQVKVRGHRIELGEIESTLRQLPQVEDAVVVDVMKEGMRYLAGYVVQKEGTTTDAEHLRSKLLTALPEYMVPGSFTFIASIPLNINGKVDIKALPDPMFADEDAYVAPATPEQEQLCNIWQEVLGLEKVGVYDNFFHIGGDSIIAIRVISKAKAANLFFKVQDLFAHPTIIDLAKVVQLVETHTEHYTPFVLIDSAQKQRLLAQTSGLQDAFPATMLQLGMLLESTRDKGVYHDVLSYRMNVAYDEVLIMRILQSMVNKHEVLRTTFIEDDLYGYLAMVHNEATPNLELIQASITREAIVEREHQRGFDFTHPGLYRLLVHNAGNDGFFFTFSVHHAIIDGWSVASLISEFTNAYTSQTEPIAGPVDMPGYGEFVKQELDAIADEDMQAFWSDYLEGYEAPAVPLVRTVMSNATAQLFESQLLSETDSKAILALSRKIEVPVDSLFLGLYHHAMSLFHNTNDLLIGLVTNNRLQKTGGDQLLGLFLNTLPFRPNITDKQVDQATWLRHIAQEKNRMLVHKALPYGEIKGRYLTEANNYQCLFNYVHFHVVEQALEITGDQDSQALEGGAGFEKINIPLTFSVNRQGDEFYVAMKAHQGSMHPFHFAQLWNYMKESILRLTQTEAEYLPLLRLTVADQTNLTAWNQPYVPYPDQLSVHAQFEQNVLKNPTKVAIQQGEFMLTYAALNERADTLAQAIAYAFQNAESNNVTDVRIGVYIDGGSDTVVAMLAILKAGGAYVPLPVNYPADRLHFMIKDADIGLVVTNTTSVEKWIEEVHANQVQVLDVKATPAEVIALPSVNANDDCYVIYTSGTSGRPKGVLTPHRAVVSLVVNNSGVPCTSNDVFLQLSNPNFDAATLEIWGALLNGGKLCFASADTTTNAALLEQAILENNVTVLWLTRTLFDSCFTERPDMFASLQYLYVGGEALSPELMKRLVNHTNRPQHLMNGYGPTESTTFTTTHNIADFEDSVPIGSAINTRQVFVLNAAMDEVPVGAPGELFIGGDGLAKGYLNRPALTEKAFVSAPDHLREKLYAGNKTLYRSGDLVRRLPDGTLEYLGRTDNQIKVRGYRIEPGEVEQALLQLPEIAQTAVFDVEMAAQKHLVAYVVLEAGKTWENEPVRQQLSENLPDYMIPSSFIVVDSIPKTANGKLDRSALENPVFESKTEYVAPQTEVQEKLCAIWQQVLGVDRVGINDNFFARGGTSISAIRLTAMSRKALGKDLPLALLFEYKTIASIEAHLQQQKATRIPVFNGDEVPLSFAQERLLFIEQYLEGTSVYHIPLMVKLTPDVDVAVMERAIQFMVERHQVLKTRFYRTQDGKYAQKVAHQTQTESIENVSGQADIIKRAFAFINVPFDLENEAPFKWKRFISDTEQYVCFIWHHIAFDGWSLDIFLHELTDVYEAFTSDLTPQLPAIEISYLDYAAWQQNHLQGERLNVLLDFWKDHLDGAQALQLPTDFARPKSFDYAGANHSFELDETTSKTLRALAMQEETTLYTVLLSGFYVTLSLLSGQKDVVVGSPTENRAHPQTQNLIGFFVNALALRKQLNDQQSFTELIRQVHVVVSQAKMHQDLPFEKLVDFLEIERDVSRHPVFQTLFSVQSFGEQTVEHSDVLFEPKSLEEAEHVTAKFDLSVSLNDLDSSITGGINYAKCLFKGASIERIADLYTQVLRAVVEQPTQPISAISMLDDEEASRLLQWSQSKLSVGNFEFPLHTLVEQAAKAFPNKTALICGQEQRTYAQLMEAANELAAHMVQAGVAHHDIVVLCQDRSVDMIVSMLATLKCGAAYMPIAPKDPQQRLAFQLQDAQPALILSHTSYYKNLQGLDSTNLPILLVDQLDTPGMTFVQPKVKAEDTAYVLYTSGTTGQPKGVLTPHRAVSSLVYNNGFMPLSEKDVLLHHSNPSFDAATLEIWGALANGGTVVISNQNETQDVRQLKSMLDQHGINILWLTRTLFDNLYVQEENLFNNLDYLLVGGEALTPALMRRLVGQPNRPKHILNGYGPTESTTFATTCNISDFEDSVPIGKPIPSRRVYVLGQAMNLVPEGCPGELYIGGAGLAKGYLNRAELTAERFVNNPFASEEDRAKGLSRLYKTGDLVRWLPNGQLAYLGRTDTQIKLRGQRIEPGEIEQQLLQLADVEQAVVIVYGKENPFLAAYIVMKPEKTMTAEAVKSALIAALPAYMVPTTFTFLREIPMNANGKLDVKSLPEPGFERAVTYIAPTNEVEKQLCQLWEEVLGLEQVGTHDNFFALGGNSINSIRLTGVARQKYELHIPLANLFEAKTIAALAKRLDATPATHIPALERDQYPLSFAQERLWFIERFEGGSDAYHIPFLAAVNDDVSWEALEKGLQTVVDRHPILNMTYGEDEDGKGYQKLRSEPIELTKSSFHSEQEWRAALQAEMKRPFDLSVEPPFRMLGYTVHEKRFVLLLWHHIAFDGWSMGVFLQDLAKVYTQNMLPPNPVGYADFAAWQRDTLKGDKATELVEWWQNQLAGFENLYLPSDYSRPAQFKYDGADFEATLDPILSTELKLLAAKQETTLYTVMLSGFYVMLSAFSGKKDILIGTPSENRAHSQTQNLLGFFVNTLPLRIQLDEKVSFATLIQHVHGIVAQAKVHQEMPFEQLVDALGLERDASRHPLFQVMFSLQDFADASTSYEGLPFTPATLEQSEANYSPAKYDLSVALNNTGEAIRMVFNYATSLFREDTVKRLCHVYTHILQTMVEYPAEAFATVEMLDVKERGLVLHNWNNTIEPFDHAATITTLFEAQVERTPNAVAIKWEGQTLSYNELNNKANAIAHTLRESYTEMTLKPFNPGTPIGLFFERHPDMLVGILAILKAGGAYVPVSVEYPDARIAFITEDSGIRVVLTHQHLQQQLEQACSNLATTPTTIHVDEMNSSQRTSNPEAMHSASDMAYIIYTSGTTGRPKGVMIAHRSVVHLAHAQQQRFNIKASKRALLFANYVFDASVFELFVGLFNGLEMHLASAEAFRNPELLEANIQNEQLEFATLPPAIAKHLDENKLSSLQTLVLAGEAPSEKMLQRFSKNTFVYNAYGPTETTVCATAHLYRLGDTANNIGKPLANTFVYVLNDELKPVPVGAVGQLYVGGAGLAMGYWNRQQLTDERFIQNPFATDEHLVKGYDKLYNTGDLVRWLPNGEVAYVGRADNQVKVRGYRIEMEEISRVLEEVDGVVQAVVIDVQKQGNTDLAAYIVAASEHFSVGACRTILQQQLPAYMVPASLNVVEEIPLTINGKIDRRALPEPVYVGETDYEAPRTDLETLLCDVWQEVLGLERVGIQDNFFHIGGDSIISIQMVSRLRKEDILLQVKDIFEAPTVAELALLIQQIEERQVDAEQGVLIGSFALLPIQQWFFDQKFAKPNHWNQAFVMKIPQGFSTETVQNVLKKLALQHDMLRVQFVNDRDKWTQTYLSEDTECFLYDNTTVQEGIDLKARLTTFQSQLDINTGPTWGVTHLTGYSDGADRLCFAFHHLLMDVVSWRIIVHDIQTLLSGEELGSKTSSYRQWVEAIKQYASEVSNTEKLYWDDVLSGYHHGSISEAASTTVMRLSAAYTERLLKDANAGYHTQVNDLLLSALGIALQKTLNKEKIHITLEGHGRENVVPGLDLTQTVGWFTTAYPVAITPAFTTKDTIVSTKEMLREVPAKGIGFGAVNVTQKAGWKLPNIGFNYLGQLDQASKNTDGLWAIVSEETGEAIPEVNADNTLLNITGGVQQGTLNFSVVSRLSEAHTTAFIAAFEAALKAVVDEAVTMAKKGGMKTPSDYGVKGFSMEHLNRLQDKYDDSNNENVRDNILEF